MGTMGDLDDGWVYFYDPSNEDNYILIHCEDWDFDEDTDPNVENLAGDSRYGYNLEEYERIVYLDGIYFPTYEEFAQFRSRMRKWSSTGFKMQIQRTATDSTETTNITFVAESGTDYNNKYFWVHFIADEDNGDEEHWYIWYDVNSTGEDPTPTWSGSAADGSIEVDIASGGRTPAEIAQDTYDDVNGTANFDVILTNPSTETLTIENDYKGSVVDIDVGEDDMPDGWFATVTTQGGTFANIAQDKADYVYVFFNSAKSHGKIYRGESDFWKIDRMTFIQYS